MVLSPPPLDGPSVVALRAFEAAARLGSFSQAAIELRVTPAAIAQHVKAVEAWAQQPLFERSARGVTLNDAGIRAQPELTEAFHALAAATQTLRDGGRGVGAIRIAALPAIAELWITPRLPAIRRLHPEANVSVHAGERPPHLHADGFDLLAFYEPTTAHPDELVLVAAPTVAATLHTIDDLNHTTRLRDVTWADHWETWLGADAGRVHPPATIDNSLFAMAVQAAERGDGVLVGPRSLVASRVDGGRLVEPFDRRVPTADALSVRVRDDPALGRLARWAAAETR